MRIGRPRSLSGLLLIGFALVAIPLLVAIAYTTIQMRRLTEQSEALVRRGVAATRYIQELSQQTIELVRRARLYQVVGDPKEIVDFHLQFERFGKTLDALDHLSVMPMTSGLVIAVRGDGAHLAESIDTAKRGTTEFAEAIDRFEHADAPRTALGSSIAAGIDTQLKELQVSANDTQQRLYWRTMFLLPGTALIVFAFVWQLARPLRQIDQAIGELGRGTFSRPIAIRGPTDLVRLGRQLEWLRARLLELAQEKNRFLRQMSHELKTPLANIREGTELLIEGAVGPLEPGQREVAAILRENAIKLQRMIENLLSFSAWQAKSVGLELSQFALRPLMRSVVGAQQLTLVAQRIRLDVKLPDAEITADRGKLRLILDNLLSNAVKFTPRDGTIFIHALADGEHLVLDLADTGPGIRLEDRGHIFEAFYTGASEQSGHVKGTGIGLSVVLDFVHAHGGTIEIIDGEHPGAHFRIRLPARPAPVASASATVAAA